MTRPKINKKQDLREKTSLDSKMLKLAKEQEAEKCLVAVRIDARTTKMIDVVEMYHKKIKVA